MIEVNTLTIFGTEIERHNEKYKQNLCYKESNQQSKNVNYLN